MKTTEEKPSAKTFAVGDRVTWTKTTSVGSGFNFKSMEGKVVEDHGHYSKVQMGNGRKIDLHNSRLTSASKQNELTKEFFKLAGAEDRIEE